MNINISVPSIVSYSCLIDNLFIVCLHIRTYRNIWPFLQLFIHNIWPLFIHNIRHSYLLGWNCMFLFIQGNAFKGKVITSHVRKLAILDNPDAIVRICSGGS